MNAPLLEMKNIRKEFPGVLALDNVNFKVDRGDIHCLVGENGAGKSTLMKVLTGVYPYGDYSGDIFINGQPERFPEFGTVRKSELPSSIRNWNWYPS